MFVIHFFQNGIVKIICRGRNHQIRCRQCKAKNEATETTLQFHIDWFFYSLLLSDVCMGGKSKVDRRRFPQFHSIGVISPKIHTENMRWMLPMMHSEDPRFSCDVTYKTEMIRDWVEEAKKIQTNPKNNRCRHFFRAYPVFLLSPLFSSTQRSATSSSRATVPIILATY